MSVLLGCLQVGAFLAIALACLRPGARRPVAALLLVLAVAALSHAILAGDAPRTLTITSTTQAYKELDVVRKEFVLDEVTAPAWRWGLLCAMFALGWAAWAWRYRDAGVAARPSHAFGAPLALAWTGLALILLLQKAAAPEGLLVPFDLGPDRVLVPATLAAALLLALAAPRILHMVLYLSLYIGVTRVALGIFATLATQQQWGTHLDVHSIDFIATPIRAVPLELLPGSTPQLSWLVWVPHMLIFPAIYMMSLGGIGFGVMMAMKQRQVDRAAAATVADA
ncbi:MAG: hypothetical protein ACYTGW_19430 [Planctomycetota bacterium]|jgi:hypothetical protein